MKREQVTERMKTLMSAEEREALFGSVHPPGLMNDPKEDRSAPKYIFQAEKKEHELLEYWLNQREWFFDHQRMDRATTNKKGIPDFIIGVYGLCVCIEFKVYGRKLTPEQEEWRRRATQVSKCAYYVYDNAGDAITMLLGMERQLNV